MKGKTKGKRFLSGLLVALMLITNVVSPMTVEAASSESRATAEINTLDEINISSTSENETVTVYADSTQEQWEEEDPGGDVDESGKAPNEEGEKPRDKLDTEDEENEVDNPSNNTDTSKDDKVEEDKPPDDIETEEKDKEGSERDELEEANPPPNEDIVEEPPQEETNVDKEEEPDEDEPSNETVEEDTNGNKNTIIGENQNGTSEIDETTQEKMEIEEPTKASILDNLLDGKISLYASDFVGGTTLTTIDITRHAEYNYATYGYGTWSTFDYDLTFEGKHYTDVYCIEASKSSPQDGKYNVGEYLDTVPLAKLLYYTSPLALDEDYFFNQPQYKKYASMTDAEKYIIIHIAASRLYENSWHKASSTAQAIAQDMISYIGTKPEVPDSDMSFVVDGTPLSATNPSALATTINGTKQETKTILFNAESAQEITMPIPAGIEYYNETNNTTTTGGDGVTVKIKGGTRFKLRASLNYSGSRTFGPMSGKLDKNFKVMVIQSTNDSYQDLAFLAYTTNKVSVTLNVNFTAYPAKISIKKVDADNTSKGLQGAVFTIYSDSACTQQVGTMETDANGNATSADILGVTQVWLKETKAPLQYELSSNVYGPYTLTPGQTTTVSTAFTNSEKLGAFTIYKQANQLDSITGNAANRVFTYANSGQAGAVFEVRAKETIRNASGQVKYTAGSLVTKVTSGANGRVTVTGLYPGTYTVTETDAPYGFQLDSSTYTVRVMFDTSTNIITSSPATVTATNTRYKVRVRVRKYDAEALQNLRTNTLVPGVVFGLYSTQTITSVAGTSISAGSLIKTVTTTANSTWLDFGLELPIGTYYIKEEYVPGTYYMRTSEVDRFTVTENSSFDSSYTYTFSTSVANTPIKGKIVVEKQGEVLTGFANAGSVLGVNNLNFTYTTKSLAGATFRLYAAANIYDGAGNLMYTTGTQVGSDLTTGTSGQVQFTGLYLGQYRVEEITVPTNYVFPSTRSKYVTLQSANNITNVTYTPTETLTFTNERQKITVKATKKDVDTQQPLSGGYYTLYAAEDIYDEQSPKNILVAANTAIWTQQITSGGQLTFSYANGTPINLPIGYSYYVKETRAPNLYVRSTQSLPFDFTYTSATETMQYKTVNFENHRTEGKIAIQKLDSDTKKATPQGDASFAGAEYTIYAYETIYNPDQRNKVEYNQYDVVGTIVLGEDGYGEKTGLYLGKYYIKETKAPEGYSADFTGADPFDPKDTTNAYIVTLTYQDDLTEVVWDVNNQHGYPLESYEVVWKQRFQIMKGGYTGQDIVPPLQGAEFKAYLLSDLEKIPKNDDGSYKFDEADKLGLAVVLSDDPNDPYTLITNDAGMATSALLPYGTYLIRESKPPANYAAVTPFIVIINQNSPDTPQQWRILLDGEPQALLCIIKIDEQYQKSVLRANTGFIIMKWNETDQKYEQVEQYTTYPGTKVKHTVFYTNENGYLFTPEILGAGKYQIIEVYPPPGYTRNTKPVEFEIDLFSAVYYDLDLQKAILETAVENTPVKMRIKVSKKGQVLTGYDEDTMLFTYSASNNLQPLEGAVYDIYAAEDIYTADNRGNIEYNAGDHIGTVTTGADGTAELEKDLPIGKYRVVETQAPEGYVSGTKEIIIELTEGEQRELGFIDIDNDPDPNPTIDLTKLPTRENLITKTAKFTNERQKIEITVVKKNANTDEPIKDVEFGLYVAEAIKTTGKDIPINTEVARAVSDANGIVAFATDLPHGKYYIREIRAPDGYASAADIEVDATYQGQDGKAPQETPTLELEYEMLNYPTKVIITKEDVGTKVGLAGAKLAIYVKEAVLDANGNRVEVNGETQWVQTEKLDENGKKVLDEQGNPIMVDKETLVREIEGTPADGTWEVQYLNPGVQYQYILREIQAPYGYLQAIDIEFIVKDTKDEQYVTMSDKTPTGSFYITKQGIFINQYPWVKALSEIAGGVVAYVKEPYVLDGVSFEVYADENIKFADGSGNLHYEKDKLVATITTGVDGVAKLEDLPLGRYRVVETSTVAGHVLDTQPRTIDLLYEGQKVEKVIYRETWQNFRKRVKVRVKKIDEQQQDTAIQGAVFQLLTITQVSAPDGQVFIPADTVIASGVTDENGELVFELDLPMGYRYKVVEVTPGEGYVTPDTTQSMEFEFTDPNDTALAVYEVETMVFSNAPTTVEVSKKDYTTQQELPGATLRVIDKITDEIVDEWISTDKPHIIQRLVVGHTYILSETIPAAGYASAQNVEFTVKDTADTQTVEMWDDITTVEISKADFTTGKALTGATLRLVDDKGNQIDEWVSGEQPHVIQRLVVGREYTLIEVLAPEGYVTASELKFIVADEIDANGRASPQTVILMDDLPKIAISKTDILTGEELPGARLQLTDKAGNIIDEWTSGKEPHLMSNLKVGETYILTEEFTPNGYVTSQSIEFTVKDTSEIQRIEMTDDVTKVEITKTDLTTGKVLEGAKMRVIDEDGNVVDEWVSKKTPHVIYKLLVGKEYLVVEEKPPDGYVTSSYVKFTIENTSSVKKVEMKDDVTKVEISKQDVVSGDQIPGAQLAILNARNEVLVKWTSTDKPHQITQLAIGNYFLVEEIAAHGYLIAETIPFEVKDTGEIQKVTMEDNRPVGKIVLEKVDASTKTRLAGVEFTITDEQGKVLERMVTDEDGHAESREYPIATYENGQYKESITYYIKETKTLDGYQLMKGTYEVRFDYVDGQTTVITYNMRFANERLPTTPETPTTPNRTWKILKVGDDTSFLFTTLMTIGSASLAVAMLTVIRKNRRRLHRKEQAKKRYAKRKWVRKVKAQSRWSIQDEEDPYSKRIARDGDYRNRGRPSQEGKNRTRGKPIRQGKNYIRGRPDRQGTNHERDP